ncbi:MAG: helix-turn-helix transcriptional regulator [Phycisphaerae bacterium]
MNGYESVLAASYDVDQLIDLTGALLEITTDISTLARVPEVLARGLDLGSLSFALVDLHADEQPVILTLETYGTPAQDRVLADDAGLRADIVALCQRHDWVGQEGVPHANSQSRCNQGLKCPANRTTCCGQCTQTVLTRQVDSRHRLVLFIDHRAAENTLPAATMEALQIALHHLAKSLHILVNCRHYPPCLGAPFATLTEREGAVLCGLNSEGGEKQIADRLGLSPHTLHSHIKSIYRKLEVQGRLPLLQKFRRALQDYRLTSLCTISVPERALVQYAAV